MPPALARRSGSVGEPEGGGRRERGVRLDFHDCRKDDYDIALLVFVVVAFAPFFLPLFQSVFFLSLSVSARSLRLETDAVV